MTLHNEVETHHAAWQRAYREASELKRLGGTYDDTPALRRANREVHVQHGLWAAARVAARDEFAKSRGWIYTAINFSPDQLRRGSLQRREHEPYYCPSCGIIDHVECFKLRHRPIAILSHTYNSWDDCVALAAREFFHVERLDWSWYAPGRCVAALFTKRQATS